MAHRKQTPVAKFAIGQMVDFVPSQRALAASVRSYKIVQALPTEGRERIYRIKTVAEVFERTARESELKKTSSPL